MILTDTDVESVDKRHGKSATSVHKRSGAMYMERLKQKREKVRGKYSPWYWCDKAGREESEKCHIGFHNRISAINIEANNWKRNEIWRFLHNTDLAKLNEWNVNSLDVVLKILQCGIKCVSRLNELQMKMWEAATKDWTEKRKGKPTWFRLCIEVKMSKEKIIVFVVI